MRSARRGAISVVVPRNSVAWKSDVAQRRLDPGEVGVVKRSVAGNSARERLQDQDPSFRRPRADMVAPRPPATIRRISDGSVECR